MPDCAMCHRPLSVREEEVCAACIAGCEQRRLAVRDKKAAIEDLQSRRQINRTEITHAKIVIESGRMRISL